MTSACPIAFLLTGGQVADCTAIDTLLEPMPATAIPHGDKGYDRDAVRRNREQGRRPEHSAKGQQATEELLFALPPPQSQRHRAHVRTPQDFLRIATRYDRLVQNFLAAVCVVATVRYWLCVWSLDVRYRPRGSFLELRISSVELCQTGADRAGNVGLLRDLRQEIGIVGHGEGVQCDGLENG